MQISFYTKGHNGDMFTPKEYIRQIIDNFPDFNFFYYHANHSKSIGDLRINTLLPTKIKKGIRFVEESPSHLLVNTWNGAYSPRWFPETKPHFYFEGTNYPQLTDTWNYIFSRINDHFGSNLIIKDKHFYIPSIDYSKFKTKNIEDFFKSRKAKRILFSNGPVHSTQSFNHDLEFVIDYLSSKYKEIDFLVTKKLNIEKENLFYTGDIIKDTSGCDLNEISYLSQFCDIIIGKNSGPYIFCITKENLSDSSKTFLQFNKREHDSLFWGIDFKCQYRYNQIYDNEYIINTIEEYI